MESFSPGFVSKAPIPEPATPTRKPVDEHEAPSVTPEHLVYNGSDMASNYTTSVETLGTYGT
jgi:hypothetical protein